MPGRLVEREAELARIRGLIKDARNGVGALALIEGAAGIGKTRLLEEAAELARTAGLSVLHARGVALEQQFAFGVARQLFERVIADAAPRERRELLSGAAALAGSLLGFGGGGRRHPLPRRPRSAPPRGRRSVPACSAGAGRAWSGAPRR